MGDTTAVRKTWRDWDAEGIDDIHILDPDGFERGDPMMNHYVYTRDEFLRRRNECTVRFGPEYRRKAGWPE